MAIISVIDNEYLYKMKLFYRKIVPSSDSFYILFFLVKFFPILLFTHGLDTNLDSNIFSLSKVIKSLSIFHHEISCSYEALCFFIYAILIFLIISFSYMFYVFYKASRTTDYKLYGIPSNKFKISKINECFFTFICYLYIIIVFFYQHLFEILFYGIFKVIFIHMDRSNLDETKILLEYKYLYTIFTLNIIFIFILMGLVYSFFSLTSGQSITNTYGFRYSFSIITTILNILFYSIQGLYSISKYFTVSFRENFQVIVCYVVLILLITKTLYNYKQVNYVSSGLFLKFVNFINNFCFVSGVTEIVIYHVNPFNHKSDQAFYFVTLAFDLINGIVLTYLIEKFQNSRSFRNLAENFFQSNKMFKIETLFSYFWELKTMGKGQNRFLLILDLFDKHQEKCNFEKCICHKYMKYLALMHNKEKIEKLIHKFFYIGETKITELIISRSNTTLSPLNQLLFLHCDYLYSIKDNIPVTLYLCQYYLLKMKNYLNFHYSYMIYEINYLTMKKIKKKDKSDKKAKGFLKENLLLDKIMKIVYILCNNIERLLHLKTLKNSNSKLIYTCEDILKPLMEYVAKNKMLIGFIISFTTKHSFELSIEVKFLLYYYSKLFNTDLPQKTNMIIYNGTNKLPSYEEFEKINFDKFIAKKNALILFLTDENRFIVRYTSTELNDILLYKRHELLGSDFNEIMIPKDIAPYHTIYMKEFILMGNKTYSKVSFLLNKNNQLIPVRINCQVQPTLSSLYTFIVNVEISQSQFYNNYYLISDTTYNLWSISESFESQFLFSVKMLNSLRINYLDFFGIVKEEVNDYFKKLKLTNSDYKKKQVNALTSVKQEEMYFYDTMDVNWLKTDAQKEIDYKSVKLVVVGKHKFANSLIKLEKNIEEYGLESEWKWKLNSLFNKLRYKTENIDASMGQDGYYNDIVNPLSKQNKDLFFFKFHLKLIGQLQYYVATISEMKDEFNTNDSSYLLQAPTTTNNPNLSFTQIKDNVFNSPSSMALRDKLNYQLFKGSSSDLKVRGDEILRVMPSQNLSSTSIYKDINSFSSLNNTLQGLKSTASLNSINQEIKVLKPKDNIKSVKAAMEKLIKDSTELKVYKFFEILFIFAVFMLNIGNFIYNQTSLTFSLNLFYINAYSFLLTNDIFYGAMASFNLCLLQDEVQRGDVENLENKIKQSAKDLMNHYQLLYSYMNNMIQEEQIIQIYSLFNTQRDYSIILPNWEEKKKTSSLIGEIYTFHYWLKNFNSDKQDGQNNCRIQTFFFNNNFNAIRGETDELATTEEQLIYYICSNIVSHVSQQLESLTKQANRILTKENKRAKLGSLAINIGILIVGVVLYCLCFFNIQSSRYLFKGKMIYLFTKHENEEIFFDDIKRFKKLLDCFSKLECLDYTTFKHSITDSTNPDGGFYMKTNVGFSANSIAIPLSPKSPNTKKSNKKTNKHRSKEEKERLKKEAAQFEAEQLEDLENKIELTNQQFSRLATPRYVNLSIIVMTVAFVLFFGCEIAGIIISTNKYNGLMTENEFATNFLSRGPKLNELVLYSIISVILNDPDYISKDQSIYKDNIISNHYNIYLDLDSNSLFQALGESNFAYLYYQIHIIRTNIVYFISSKDMQVYLPMTSKNERLFDDKENFCVYATYQYVEHYYSGEVSEDDFLTLMSQEAHQCRQVGNGMNLSGYNSGLDLMIQLLQNLYFTFKNEETNFEERQKTFLESEDLKIIEENLLNVIRSLHFADSFLVIDDINNSYMTIHAIKVGFSVASIVLTCVVILGIILTVISKLDYYNEVCTDIVNMFDRALKNYNELSQ